MDKSHSQMKSNVERMQNLEARQKGYMKKGNGFSRSEKKKKFMVAHYFSYPANVRLEEIF